MAVLFYGSFLLFMFRVRFYYIVLSVPFSLVIDHLLGKG